ncbi:MAG: hypothetical protein SF028_01705 [Candidatus Sumerlaeia bacterium]|nr:hypothetical protein [Candidatus Sumerlaeia bacterium]
MRPPRHWNRTIGAVKLPEEELRFVFWGHSEEGPEEALRQAEELLRHAHRHFEHPASVAWEYGYQRSPLRELLVEELFDDGVLAAFTTRTRYGALALNTDRVLFADVDLPPPGCLYIGRRAKWEARAVGRVRDRLASRPETRSLGRRLYRTPNGIRIAFTTPAPAPHLPEGQALLAACGADKLYMRLCLRQQCSRARLTAKPWRCGLKEPPLAFPLSEEEWRRYRDWLAAYDTAAAKHAACRFLEASGPPAEGVLGEIIRYHDEACGAFEPRPLA